LGCVPSRKGVPLLRLLLNFIIVFLVAHLARSFFQGSKRAFRRSSPDPRRPRPNPKREEGAARPYSEITPYEIEDADYEEIRD